jgi:hypothetical protein
MPRTVNSGSLRSQYYIYGARFARQLPQHNNSDCIGEF